MEIPHNMKKKKIFISFLVINLGINVAHADKDIAQCGSRFNMTEFSLRITSPGNYTSYPKNLDCDWLLKAPSEEDTVLYRFEDVRVDCGDGVSAFDGNDRSANAQTKDLCTTGGPIQTALQTTSGSNLLVNFKTNNISKESEKGFYTQAISGRDLSYCPVSNTKVNLTATPRVKVITSPNFPRRYSSNYQCEWNITSEDPKGSIQITFAFIDIDTDANSGSCFDSVTIYEGTNKTKEICGSEIFSPGADSEIQSSGNNIRIVFTSDNIQTEYGFKLLYRQIVKITPTQPATTVKTTTTTSPTTSTVTNPTTTSVTTPTTTSVTIPTTTSVTNPTTTTKTTSTTTTPWTTSVRTATLPPRITTTRYPITMRTTTAPFTTSRPTTTRKPTTDVCHMECTYRYYCNRRYNFIWIGSCHCVKKCWRPGFYYWSYYQTVYTTINGRRRCLLCFVEWEIPYQGRGVWRKRKRRNLQYRQRRTQFFF